MARSSVAAAASLAAVGTAGILFLLKAVVRLRASATAEVLGIDMSEHAEAAYVLETAQQS